ncbi:hypothetical protein Cni_G25816 [Canna indica]|uniref:Uncharacterized protein n=1 Tax=Canna indica TaxID=4628 RepID=A0AAQ3L515_9LILI|nr:hypothetical protein Cni_G25816 [Canna indica]
MLRALPSSQVLYRKKPVIFADGNYSSEPRGGLGFCWKKNAKTAVAGDLFARSLRNPLRRRSLPPPLPHESERESEHHRPQGGRATPVAELSNRLNEVARAIVLLSFPESHDRLCPAAALTNPGKHRNAPQYFRARDRRVGLYQNPPVPCDGVPTSLPVGALMLLDMEMRST